jgi:predicted metal-binding transcription factor (methanogenesis marker protein 9)
MQEITFNNASPILWDLIKTKIIFNDLERLINTVHDISSKDYLRYKTIISKLTYLSTEEIQMEMVEYYRGACLPVHIFMKALEQTGEMEAYLTIIKIFPGLDFRMY